MSTPIEQSRTPRVSAPIARAWAWADGRVTSPEEVRVPLEDRGVLFGESVYEALLTRDGRAFALEPHLLRLQDSAGGVGIDITRVREQVRASIAALLSAGGEGDGLLYLHVSGGVAPRDHMPPAGGLEPGLYATLRPFDHAALRRAQAAGISVGTVADPRWQAARWKTTQLLGNVLGKRAVAARGAAEVIFTAGDEVLEGGSSNLWIVRDGVARTPPADRNILPGITRALLLEHAPCAAEESVVTLDDLRTADEVFITSTTRPVLGVVEVDGTAVGDRTPGPVTRRLAAFMHELLDADCAAPTSSD